MKLMSKSRAMLSELRSIARRTEDGDFGGGKFKANVTRFGSLSIKSVFKQLPEQKLELVTKLEKLLNKTFETYDVNYEYFSVNKEHKFYLTSKEQ